jgi:hypothetical protein
VCAKFLKVNLSNPCIKYTICQKKKGLDKVPFLKVKFKKYFVVLSDRI